MTFWKISNRHVNCKISQEEIIKLGYALPELQKNQEKTKAFINLLLEDAHKLLDVDITNGVQNFVAALLPDQSIFLSISCEDYDMEIENSLEQLKQTSEKLSNLILSSKIDEIEKLDGDEKAKEYSEFMEQIKDIYRYTNTNVESIEVEISDSHGEQDTDSENSPKVEQDIKSKYPLHYMVKYNTLDEAVFFAKKYGVKDLFLQTQLIKYQGFYYLCVDFKDDADKQQIVSFVFMNNEFGGYMENNSNFRAVLLEHGEPLIGDHALEHCQLI